MMVPADVPPGEFANPGEPGQAGIDRSVRLLEGEDPGGIEDARQWIHVYTALVDLKRRRLDRVTGDGSDDDEVMAAKRRTRVHRANQVLQGCRDRLEFWYRRMQELQAIDLERETRIVTHRGRETMLTNREYQLLEFLMRFPGLSFTSSQLLLHAWHRSDLSAEQVRLYVGQLRKKLRDTGVPCEVVNEPRRGYSLVFQPPVYT
jgi:hypothetical protein